MSRENQYLLCIPMDSKTIHYLKMILDKDEEYDYDGRSIMNLVKK